MKRLLSLMLVLLPVVAGALPVSVWRYSAGEVADDPRYQYYWDLVAAALKTNEARYGKAVLEPVSDKMNGERVVNEMRTGGRVDIMVRTTSRVLEEVLQPVRIPLDKGLTGYRLMLVRKGREAELSGVDSLSGLRRFSLGQQDSWVDVAILRDAGFTVTTANHYEGLFAMLDKGRFDLLPRGVNEIGREFRLFAQRYPALSIDRRLLLYYPLPRYVFLPRTERGARMAARLEDGLRRLIASGEFERRYQAYKQGVLADSRLAGRRLIRIPNPYLPAATPLSDASLWDPLTAELSARH
ncbi:amino acid ABC transporter substrate-binding protein [Paludibacterium paludis]|uniref:Solute-binding protein family 3/N-terminal domain-containing protein n=1 Tax=Paludibacterium paludis TaxID=1225769 RepID=A0A918P4Y2_9NEIS|nr:amino acid ABC transporter substrate-binding protein [Paludibacterium paludis]GGY19781.1 hypothetical protein GCM10011289_24030 [Paludibacterium paludis]